MQNYRIVINGEYVRTVQAEDADAALVQWLSDAGFHSIEEAAREYGCSVEEVEVVEPEEMGDDNDED